MKEYQLECEFGYQGGLSHVSGARGTKHPEFSDLVWEEAHVRECAV